MISVIIATKNGSRWIERAIRSIQEQTEKDIEVIIADDGSTDDTAQKVTALAEKDSRIRLIPLSPSRGPGLARDHAIKEAKGEYISLLDDDDYWISKNKLALQKKYLDEHADTVLVGANRTDLVREDGSHISYYDNPMGDAAIRNSILLKNRFVASSVMFRKNTYLEVGGFSPLFLSEDYDLWLRLGQRGSFANIADADTAHTIHENSASSTRRLELYQSTLRLVWTYRKQYPQAYLGLAMALGRIALFHLKKIF